MKAHDGESLSRFTVSQEYLRQVNEEEEIFGIYLLKVKLQKTLVLFRVKYNNFILSPL